MTLSKESEHFLIELRLYLISKGKNDDEINGITEELEVHLLEAETEGKDVTHIIGESPKRYIKSIGENMKTDFRQLAIVVPMGIFLLAAYFSIGPAIEGTFTLSKNFIWVSFLSAVLGIAIYSVFLFKVLPKFINSSWGFVLMTVTSMIVTGLIVVLLLWFSHQEGTPTFVATPFQNTLIVIFCAIIFIASAIYTKTWFTILIPVFISLGPLANRFIPEEVNKNLIYISYTVILMVVITSVILFLLLRKRKKVNKL